MNTFIVSIFIIALVSANPSCPSTSTYDLPTFYLISPASYMSNAMTSFFNLLADYGNQKNNLLAAPLRVDLGNWFEPNGLFCLSEYNVFLGCESNITTILDGFDIERATRCDRRFFVDNAQILSVPTTSQVSFRINFIENFYPCTNGTFSPSTPATTYYFSSNITMNKDDGCPRIQSMYLFLY